MDTGDDNGGGAAETASAPTRAARHRERSPHSPVRRALTWAGGIAVVVVVALLAYIGYEYVNLDRGLQRSNILGNLHSGEPEQPGLSNDVNMLIMGLDSRLDLKGKPLPKEVYQAMRTGDETKGGMNTNVLMFAHIPADGRPATVIQIPRDNLVDYAGCPGNKCKGKIKEAYDAAFEAKQAELADLQGMTAEEKHQKARDAGRAEEIKTVEKFLGNGIRINQWVEVTMAAFYELAQAVQPITVCLKHDTQDTEGAHADFKAGKQQINAEQAMAFVRQRREVSTPPGLPVFTDLDRERRQQAFIASLAYQLKQKGTFADPRRLNDLINVAKSNVAVDEGLNILDFAQQARQLTEGKVTFYTLPVKDGKITEEYGWVNLVDLPQIQATVKSLLAPPAEPAPSASPTTTTPKPSVSVVNASGVNGAAGQVLTGLVGAGYGKGETSTAGAARTKTTVEYSSGQSGAAAELAEKLGPGVTTEEVAEVPAGQLRVVLGSGYQLPPSLGGPSGQPGTSGTGPRGSATPSATPLTPSSVGDAGKKEDTEQSTLTAMSGGGIPCVR